MLLLNPIYQRLTHPPQLPGHVIILKSYLILGSDPMYWNRQELEGHWPEMDYSYHERDDDWYCEDEEDWPV